MRPWRRADAPSLVAAHAGDPELSRQWGSDGAFDRARAESLIAERLATTARAQHWAIADRSDGRALGGVGVSAIDRVHGTAWVHYWLAADARGRGLATAALATASAWAFEAGLFRLELGHRTNNPASCAVATRCGYVAEGIERQKLLYEGRRFDVETHALLATDERPHTTMMLPWA